MKYLIQKAKMYIFMKSKKINEIYIYIVIIKIFTYNIILFEGLGYGIPTVGVKCSEVD